MRRDMVLMYLGANPPDGEGQEVRSWNPRLLNGRGLGVRRLTNILCRPIGKCECSLCRDMLTPVWNPRGYTSAIVIMLEIVLSLAWSMLFFALKKHMVEVGMGIGPGLANLFCHAQQYYCHEKAPRSVMPRGRSGRGGARVCLSTCAKEAYVPTVATGSGASEDIG